MRFKIVFVSRRLGLRVLGLGSLGFGDSGGDIGGTSVNSAAAARIDLNSELSWMAARSASVAARRANFGSLANAR